MTNGQSPRSVLVVSCAADVGFAEEAVSAARAAGCAVLPRTAPPESADLCLVLMSQEAVADKDYLARAQDLCEQAPLSIPVRLDNVSPELSGQPDASIRKITWANLADSSDPARRAERWRALLSSQVSLYKDFYDIESRARRWADAGGYQGHLYQSRAQARHAHNVLALMRNDPFNTPTKAMDAYVAASMRHARRLFWQHFSHGFRAVAAVFAIAAVAFFINAFLGRFQDMGASLMREVYADEQEDPVLLALLAMENTSTMLIQTDATVIDLLDSLQQNWEVSHLGIADAEKGIGQGEGRFTEDGTYVARATDGTLGYWDPQTAEPLRTRAVSSDAWFSFDVTDGGSTVAVSDSRGVTLFGDAPGDGTLVTDALASCDRVALSADGSALLCQEGSALSLLDCQSGRVTPVGAYDTILYLGRSEQGLRALVVSGSQLQLLDPVLGGEALMSVALPEAQILCGTVGPQGTVAVCADGTLLAAMPGDAALAPLGSTTYDLPSALVLTDNALIVATAQEGAQVVDLATGATLGSVCPSMTGVRTLVAQGNLVACGNASFTSIGSVEGLIGSPEQPETGHLSTGASDESSDMSVRATDDGLYVVTRGDLEGTFAVSATLKEQVPASVVAVMGSSYAVGTETGLVEAYSDTGDGHFLRTLSWSSPNGEPITAIGWTEDMSRLVIQSGGRWWTPYSNSRALEEDALQDMMLERIPAGLSESFRPLLSDEVIARLRLTFSQPALPAE